MFSNANSIELYTTHSENLRIRCFLYSKCFSIKTLKIYRPTTEGHVCRTFAYFFVYCRVQMLEDVLNNSMLKVTHGQIKYTASPA
jgi:hypothetical protein